jgi:2-C-methyl-D-erythritol 4-phosphate cytidylyltransferase
MPETTARLDAVIVAAGASRRMGADKVMMDLGGKPLLAWSGDVIQACDTIRQIVIVLSPDNLEAGRRLVAERGWDKVRAVCPGGERRQDSVRAGLEHLKDSAYVAIHDGARPFITRQLLEDGLRAAAATGAAIAAVPARDTVKWSGEGQLVARTLDRDRVWLVQTPQVFRFDIITDACRKVAADVTDDAAMVEMAGGSVKLYMGSYSNLKITTPDDMALARARLAAGGGAAG